MAQRPRPTKFMTTTRTCAHTHARARAHSHARARLHWARAHAHVHALHRTIQAVQERASQRHHDIHVTRPHLFKRSTHGEIQERLFPPHPPLTGTSNLKPQTSNLKPQTSKPQNLKPQTSNLKPQTSNRTPPHLNPHDPAPADLATVKRTPLNSSAPNSPPPPSLPSLVGQRTYRRW